MCCDIARNDGTGDPRAARPVNADWLRQVALAVAADSRVVQPGLLAVGAAGKVVVLAEKAEGPGCRAAAALRPDFRGLLPAGVGEVPVDPGRGISRPGAGVTFVLCAMAALDNTSPPTTAAAATRVIFMTSVLPLPIFSPAKRAGEPLLWGRQEYRSAATSDGATKA